MTKSIASYPENQRQAVIMRRISKATREGGAGYFAAVAAAKALGIKVPERKPFQRRDDTERKPRPEKKVWRKPSIQNRMRVRKEA